MAPSHPHTTCRSLVHCQPASQLYLPSQGCAPLALGCALQRDMRPRRTPPVRASSHRLRVAKSASESESVSLNLITTVHRPRPYCMPPPPAGPPPFPHGLRLCMPTWAWATPRPSVHPQTLLGQAHMLLGRTRGPRPLAGLRTSFPLLAYALWAPFVCTLLHIFGLLMMCSSNWASPHLGFHSYGMNLRYIFFNNVFIFFMV